MGTFEAVTRPALRTVTLTFAGSPARGEAGVIETLSTSTARSGTLTRNFCAGLFVSSTSTTSFLGSTTADTTTVEAVATNVVETGAVLPAGTVTILLPTRVPVPGRPS